MGSNHRRRGFGDRRSTAELPRFCCGAASHPQESTDGRHRGLMRSRAHATKPLLRPSPAPGLVGVPAAPASKRCWRLAPTTDGVGVAVVMRSGTGPLVHLPRYSIQHDRDHRDHPEREGETDANDELSVVAIHATSKLYSVARRWCRLYGHHPLAHRQLSP